MRSAVARRSGTAQRQQPGRHVRGVPSLHPARLPPPLRARREDILLLASYFVEKYAAVCNRKLKGISPDARTALLGYDWPGNVRELENTIERAVVLGTTDFILTKDFAGGFAR